MKKKLEYSNGVIYNCKHFPFGGYKAIMFFWFIFTKELPEEFDKCELYHEQIHQMQYFDCIGLGLAASIILVFTLLAFEIQSWWLILFILLPFLFYYILYGLNFIVLLFKYFNWHKAYRNICFERQAYTLDDEGELQCQQRTPYTSLSWIKYI